MEFNKYEDKKITSNDLKDLVLTIEQVKHLEELGLKLDKTYLYYRRKVHGWKLEDNKIGDWFVSNYMIELGFGFEKYEMLPTLTLDEILNMLPDTIVAYSDRLKKDNEYDLHIDYDCLSYDDIDVDNDMMRGCWTTLKSFCKHNRLLDNAYDTLCWCLENGYKVE